jgi:hypothetical protein
MENVYSKSDLMLLTKTLKNVIVPHSSHYSEDSNLFIFFDTIVTFIQTRSHEYSSIKRDLNQLTYDLYLKYFNSDQENKLRSLEWYGEGKYFALLDYDNLLRFRISKLNLKKFLFEAPVYELPLLLNISALKYLVLWRIEIGK